MGDPTVTLYLCGILLDVLFAHDHLIYVEVYVFEENFIVFSSESPEMKWSSQDTCIHSYVRSRESHEMIV